MVSIELVVLGCSNTTHNANFNNLPYIGWMKTIVQYDLAPQTTLLAEQFTK